MNNYFSQRAQAQSLEVKNLADHADFPKNALVELTNSCNHACLFCKNPDQARHAQKINLKIYEKFIAEASYNGLKEVGLYATGEPFMLKDLDEYIRIAKRYKVKRVYITTNGVLATLDRVKQCIDAGLDSIKFSINAANKSDYKKIHGYDDFDTVNRNVREIYQYKNSNNLSIQLLGSCVLVPALRDTKEQHYNIFSDYFEDISYNIADSQGGQAFELPFPVDLTAPIFGDVKEKPIQTKPCQMPWNRIHLTAEGYISACCVDYNLDLIMGDLNNKSLLEIWNGETAKVLRTKHMVDRLEGLLCDQCMNNRPAPFSPLTTVEFSVKSQKVRENELKKLRKRFIEVKPI